MFIVWILTLGFSAWSTNLQLRSKAFDHMTEIPARFTCDGEDVSPPLEWEGTPVNAKSLALIVDDPDAPDPAAPQMTWVHWVLFNMPPATHELGPATVTLPSGAASGLNDWKRTSYSGPCPPVGRHRYHFKLYALDSVINMRKPTKKELEQAMAGHVVAQAELVGTYKRKASQH